MSRRKAAPKRVILPDPLFKSELLAKFMNSVMNSGKKSLAERIVYGALQQVVEQAKANPKAVANDDGESGGGSAVKKLSNTDIREDQIARDVALDIFQKALDSIMPTVEVKSRRVGGSTYQVPVEIRQARRLALGMRWLVEYANKRNEKTMTARLANEMMDAIEGRGGAFKKKEDVHRMAKANQAFAHYRW